MPEHEEGLLEQEATFVVDGVEVSPTGYGYTAVHNYAHYFWRPYLGNTAFALWELLLSFCYGDGDIAYPSIARLARMLSNSDYSRAVVTGRRKTSSKGGGNGALDVLRRERLVQVERKGEGHMTSYTFRVLKTLPVLRPDQLARLSSRLRHDHNVWLERRGIDAATYHEAFAGDARPPTQHAGSGRPCAPVLTPPYATRTTPPYAPGTTASAPRTTGDAPSTGGAVPSTGGAVPDTGGAVPSSTNHPQKESLPNHPQEESLPNQWWQQTLDELKPQLIRGTFELCLMRTQVGSFEDGLLTLHAASPLVQDFMQHRLLPLLQRTLQAISQGQVREVVVE